MESFPENPFQPVQRSVLVVDDQLMDVINAVHVLSVAQYRVDKLISASGIYAKIDYFRPQILLLNPFVSRLSPLGLLNSIRRNPELADLIVVLFSDEDARTLQQYCMDLDVHGYYSKSMGIDQLPEFLNHFYEDS